MVKTIPIISFYIIYDHFTLLFLLLVSLDGLVALWCDAVDKAERAGNRRARRHKKRVHKTRPAKTDSHTQSLRMATAATTLLGYALTVADRPPEKKSGETVTGSTAQPTNVEGTLECAHCGATGKFRSKDQNVPGAHWWCDHTAQLSGCDE